MRNLLITIAAVAFLAASAMAGVGSGVPTSVNVSLTIDSYADVYWTDGTDLTGSATPGAPFSDGDTLSVQANKSGTVVIALAGGLSTTTEWTVTTTGMGSGLTFVGDGSQVLFPITITATPLITTPSTSTLTGTIVATATCS